MVFYFNLSWFKRQLSFTNTVVQSEMINLNQSRKKTERWCVRCIKTKQKQKQTKTTWKTILLHTHIDILNLISLKNVTWHLTFRYINRWTLCRMVISTACDNCIISRDDFILQCEIKYRRTEYESSLGICCQIWTRSNNDGTV